jgi:transposase
VRLASELGNTQAGIERNLGISLGIIRRWKRELLASGEQAFPGKGRLKPDDKDEYTLWSVE